jgi:hypothetical protein
LHTTPHVSYFYTPHYISYLSIEILIQTKTIMETVNRYVNAASTAIWGENGSSSNPHNLQHGEEPISGVQGKGGVTDPYDAGNREGKLEPLHL